MFFPHVPAQIDEEMPEGDSGSSGRQIDFPSFLPGCQWTEYGKIKLTPMSRRHLDFYLSASVLWICVLIFVMWQAVMVGESSFPGQFFIVYFCRCLMCVKGRQENMYLDVSEVIGDVSREA